MFILLLGVKSLAIDTVPDLVVYADSLSGSRGYSLSSPSEASL